MKKLHKLILAPLPVIAVLPTMAFVTSCSEYNWNESLASFKKAYAEAKETFKQSGKWTESLQTGLEQVGDIEQAMIEGHVLQHENKTLANLRKEKFQQSEWDDLYGACGEEREKIFVPIRNAKKDKGLWIDEEVVDIRGKSLKYYSIALISEAYVLRKGTYLKDLSGWASDLIVAAEDISIGKEPSTHNFPDSELYAVVDGNNIGNLYQQSTDKYPSPTLAMYKYYSNLPADSERFQKFYTNTLNLNIYWEMDKKLDIIMNRLDQNFYLYIYTEEHTSIKWDEQGKAWVREALRDMLVRIEKIIKGI